ncbi:MAG: amidohydrolase family protein [Pseudomonadota bacterium]
MTIRYSLLLSVIALSILIGCERPPASGEAPADLIITNAKVYTLQWDNPTLDGAPATNAPFDGERWSPDAAAIAMRDGLIVAVGSHESVQRWVGPQTRLRDVNGATVLPGLVDSHTHVFELGALLDQVNLTGVASEAEAIALIAARAAKTPEGEWITGSGWDEGAWADNYPNKTALSEAVPNHPVYMGSLHGFAGWANQRALDEAGITAESAIPRGGEMWIGSDGEPTGLFINRATQMMANALPPPSAETLERHALLGLEQMAEDGYVAVHDAGDNSAMMTTLLRLEAAGKLPIRFYAMLSLRDEPLIREWIERGPDADTESRLVTRSVKAYYDGALGSRGARLLADYSDMPGHRGVSGSNYGFDEALMADAMRAGFQIAIHAIGDAGNREAMDILERVYETDPATRQLRHRIEHAQVIAPADMGRLAELGLIASMEPPHAMEDKTWAEARLGPTRILGAYAWRSLREAGTQITFNADNPGSDHSIFYGLHSAVTRRDPSLQPTGGWYPEQRFSIDEAIRAYTTWSAYASFRGDETGVIEPGRWADLTVMDIDPFDVAVRNPDALLSGKILMTIVGGDVLYERSLAGAE